MKLDDLELGDYRLRFKLIEELNDEMIELLDELWENMDDDTDGYISDSYDTLDGVAWSIYWIRDIMKAEGVLLDLLEDVSEPQLRFLIQKKLKEYANDIILDAIDYVIKMKTEDDSDCTYDVRKLIRKYLDALRALKKTYSELY